MKKGVLTIFVVVSLAAALWVAFSGTQTKWPGVDEAVVEKFARGGSHDA